MLISCLTYSFTLKLGATYFCETSVDVYLNFQLQMMSSATTIVFHYFEPEERRVIQTDRQTAFVKPLFHIRGAENV
jgi:hypothetical protein